MANGTPDRSRTSSGPIDLPPRAALSGSGGRPDRHHERFLRTSLAHTPPPWVADGSLFFITICCHNRDLPLLTTLPAAEILMDAARHYHDIGRWFLRLFLLMPDHLHALIAFPPHEKMSEVLRNWKAFTNRRAGITWQRNYFDHRLRTSESWDEKADYIRMNPVRRGLAVTPTAWPFFIEH